MHVNQQLSIDFTSNVPTDRGIGTKQNDTVIWPGFIWFLGDDMGRFWLCAAGYLNVATAFAAILARFFCNSLLVNVPFGSVWIFEDLYHVLQSSLLARVSVADGFVGIPMFNITQYQPSNSSATWYTYSTVRDWGFLKNMAWHYRLNNGVPLMFNSHVILPKITRGYAHQSYYGWFTVGILYIYISWYGILRYSNSIMNMLI